VAHEASVGKINEDVLFYLQSHGIPEDEAKTLIVRGFVSPLMKELPLEYAAEMNILIGMEME
jgi:Fe-S cluster assembly protein SufB